MNRAMILNSTVGEYRVTDFLGAGGMGEVYRAVHTRIGHVVALKILTAESADSCSGQRFTWEARVQARLNHPNIAAFHGLTECQGHACIVMEYVDGQTLSDRIRFGGPLAASEALTIFEAVGEAVAHMHGQGIIHRDIKSNNVKINAAGRVKLLDFGIASSAAAPRLTMAGFVVGALGTLSPEQLLGQRADERADIWALGVLLYEMATGQMPFTAEGVGQLCEMTAKCAYTPPDALNPALPRQVAAIIKRCLRKNPDARFQSAAALLEETRRARAALSGSQPRQSSHPTPRQTLHQKPDQKPDQVNVKAPKPVINRKAAWGAALAAVVALVFYFSPSPSPSGPTKPVALRTTEGTASVWRDGKYVGETPLKFDAPLGAQLKLKLARAGYKEKLFTIRVGEGANEYDYTLEKNDSPRR